MSRFLRKEPEQEPFDDIGEPGAFKSWIKVAMLVASLAGAVALAAYLAFGKKAQKAPADMQKSIVAKVEPPAPPPPPPDLHNPVRKAPASFPPDSNLPRGKEIYASGPIDLKTFNPTNDIIRFTDARVWFESDYDKTPVEDDHLIHRAMEVPLKRLVNLAEKRRGTVKIHEAYRSAAMNNVHLTVSLHCEGRAVDLTSENLSLSDLAKLAWQSGFDFVLYEKPRKSGVHLHCSVKRTPDAPLPPRPEKGG